MTVKARLFEIVLLGAVAVCAFGTAAADEVKGRWRFDIQLGNTSPGGRIDSQAGSGEILIIPDGPEQVVYDPRPQSAYGTYANSRGNGRVELHASYGMKAFKNSELVIDFGVGYYKQTIRNIEWSYSFDSNDINFFTNRSQYGKPGCETLIALDGGVAPVTDLYGCTWFSQSDWLNTYSGTPGIPTSATSFETSDFNNRNNFTTFRIERVEGGELKVIPLSVDLLMRFRPTKRFNPYLGGGLGYLFVTFTESERWKQIADQMEGSLVSNIVGPIEGNLDYRALQDVQFTPLDTNEDGQTDAVRADKLGHAMIRPRIDAPSTWYFQVRAGLEFQLSPHWSLFTDGKFFWANKNITITADGVQQFGSPTPNITVPRDIGDQLNPAVYPNGGRGVYVIKGGLQQPGVNPYTGDPTDPFTTPGINGSQPGEYYMNGGELKYGGWVFTLGVRWTL